VQQLDDVVSKNTTQGYFQNTSHYYALNKFLRKEKSSRIKSGKR
jgi:hypothetical protein